MKNGIILFALILSLTACKNKTASDATETMDGDSITINLRDADTSHMIETNLPENTTTNNTETKTTTPVKVDDMQSGTIMTKGGSWVIRETDAKGNVTDYYAENLADEFKKDGLKVKFKGFLTEIPSNVRLIGKPITITKMVKA